jgi:hypothetical protein
MQIAFLQGTNLWNEYYKIKVALLPGMSLFIINRVIFKLFAPGTYAESLNFEICTKLK